MNDHVCKRFIWSCKKNPSSSSTSIWLYLFFDSSGDVDQIIMQKRWWVSLQYARARMLSVNTFRRAPTLFSSSPWLSLRFRLPAP